MKQINSKNKLFAPLILVVLFFFGMLMRFWQIDQAPKGALIDELHFGYIAQSLIKTGADEHGQKWPLIFEGFGDRKLPAMAYLDIPSVYFFGLSLLAIRIPSALAGSLLILVSYWLVLEATNRKKWALLGALITTISPWTFFLSRFGFESNLALLFLTMGLAGLFSAERTKKNKWYIISAIGFGLTWYSYIAYRPIVAILLFVFAFLKLKTNFKENKKAIFILLLSFALVVAPLFAPSIISVNSTRFDQVGIASDPGTAQVINEKRNFCSMHFPRFFCDIASNKFVFIFKELTHRYLSAFSPQYLVTRGELTTDFLAVDSFGQFFPPLYPLLLFGLIGLITFKNHNLTKNQKWLLFIGLLISPIPTALVGEPQKVRISALYTFMLIFIVYGAMVVDKLLKNKIFKSLFFYGLIVALLGYTFLFQIEYLGVHTTQYEYKYQSYLPGLNQYLGNLPEDTLINIVPFYSDPLMFYAFYTNMDPALYQSLAVIDDFDGANFRHTLELGNVFAHKYSPEYVACLGMERGAKAYFVTDKKLENLFKMYEEKSTNGVNTYAYVYDVTELMIKEDCENKANF
ncbi:MAG: phospholipid carrier-dependent glycosyltransferase [Pseudomonadales bacterium]|nr:phospholipid carrier-dependent glycosyltransferase [Pseudomonadales bacterium]